ncbi:MAG: hypothetical protein AAB772_00785 [Patescibacteria group bacterium]
MKIKLLKKNNEGQVVLLTVLVLGGSILGASAIAGYLMLLSIRGATDLASSAKAISSADAGVEWELFRVFQDNTYPAPIFLNNATVSTTVDLASLRIDQSQTLEDVSINADTGAQSFTVGRTVNNIASAAVKFGGTVSGSYLIQFNVRLAGDSTLIGSANTAADLTPTASIVNATFTPPLNLNSDLQYLLEWQKDEAGSPTSSVLIVRYKTADPYPAGVFSIDSTGDIYFQTFYNFDRKIKAVGRAANVFRAFELRLGGATTTLGP